jgi:hypothetical protein
MGRHLLSRRRGRAGAASPRATDIWDPDADTSPGAETSARNAAGSFTNKFGVVQAKGPPKIDEVLSKATRAEWEAAETEVSRQWDGVVQTPAQRAMAPLRRAPDVSIPPPFAAAEAEAAGAPPPTPATPATPRGPSARREQALLERNRTLAGELRALRSRQQELLVAVDAAARDRNAVDAERRRLEGWREEMRERNRVAEEKEGEAWKAERAAWEACRAAEARSEESARESADLKVALEGMIGRVDEELPRLVDAVEAERREKEALLERVRALEAQRTLSGLRSLFQWLGSRRLRVLHAAMGAWRARTLAHAGLEHASELAALQHAHEEREAELSRVEAEGDARASMLEAATRRLRGSETMARSHAAAAEAARADAETLRRSHAELASSHAELTKSHAELSARLEAANKFRGEAETARADAARHRAQSAAQIAESAREAAEQRERADRHEALHAEARARHEALLAERREAQSELERLRRSHRALSLKHELHAANHRREVLRHARALAEARQEFSDMTAARALHLREAQTREATLVQQLRRGREEHRAHRDWARSVDSERARLQREVAAQTEALKTLRAELDTARAVARELRAGSEISVSPRVSTAKVEGSGERTEWDVESERWSPAARGRGASAGARPTADGAAGLARELRELRRDREADAAALRASDHQLAQMRNALEASRRETRRLRAELASLRPGGADEGVPRDEGGVSGPPAAVGRDDASVGAGPAAEVEAGAAMLGSAAEVEAGAATKPLGASESLKQTLRLLSSEAGQDVDRTESLIERTRAVLGARGQKLDF